MKRGNMNKRYYAVALLICLILLVSACKKSGASAGGAPRTPFIGGTSGITINFEKDSPPPEVTDDESFSFNAIVRLKNDGEAKVEKNDIKLNLVGFDPNDFGKNFEDLKDQQPEDLLDAKKRDAEGNIVDGTTTFATFPKGGTGAFFNPRKFSGNTEFTFRADACYHYKTEANTKVCVLKDMINVRDDSLCKPTSSRTVYSSAAPVQVSNFRQTVVGKDKLSFSFDISLSGNVDIFWDKQESKPSSFDTGCPRDPRARRERESNVGVEILEMPVDPVFSNPKCGGLDAGHKGVVKLVSGKRTITCTADLATDRLDLEKTVGIRLLYNVLDNKETKVLVKHLATEGGVAS
ncbi:hypothetical protein J4234_05095 [Candidatus Woesearchaeota archaeon]|nr:hypothetical protein [Candidatus Woesearchaeota archaeon]